jgi:hypothetical protein
MHKLIPSILFSVVALSAAPADELAKSEARLDSLSDYVTSTVMGKDDKPVSASGDVAIRVKNFYYDKVAPLQISDKARTTAAEAMFSGVLSATPTSDVNLWTTLVFPFDFSGYFQNILAKAPNSGPYNQLDRVPFEHSTDFWGTGAIENMTAGIDMRAGAFAGMLKAGGVLWASQSPLTMWERETAPRFLSQYELFEEEKTVSTYYKEKSFRPVKEGGRAFWTNRSFGGLLLDIYTMPGDMVAQFMLSQPNDMDAGTRDGLRMYGGQPGEIEMTGGIDLRGLVYAGRIAKQKLFNDVTLGVNYVGVQFDQDIVYEPEFLDGFKLLKKDPYLVDNHIVSLDMKGNIAPNLFAFVDMALAFDDSTKFYKCQDTVTVKRANLADTIRVDQRWSEDTYSRQYSTPEPGFYAKIQSKHWEPITLEMIYLPKNFFSPYGMTDNSRFRSWRKDEFYLGAGTFRYGPNLAGANLKLEPVFNRGRFDVQYGLHSQLEKGQDEVLFNYRLNGRNMWESSNSWTKFKPLMNMDSGNADGAARSVSRVGVLTPGIKFDRQRGGLYGGTWEMWESFGAYENVDQLKVSTLPEHQKWSAVLAIDAGYDIGNWFNTDRNIMMAVNASMSGVSTSFTPLAYSSSQSDMLLWSLFVQSEPAIALTPTLHAVGIFGFETWRAQQAYRQVALTLDRSLGLNNRLYGLVGANGIYYELSPINNHQTALGFGFDWDFAPRAGLHVRYKRATHTDETVSANNWKAHIVTAETKVWF